MNHPMVVPSEYSDATISERAEALIYRNKFFDSAYYVRAISIPPLISHH